MKSQIERFIQTAIHSNPSRRVTGWVYNAVGTITISFPCVFLTTPILIGLNPLNTTGDSTIRHKKWLLDIVDIRQYTGMEVESNGIGNIICYEVEGITRDLQLGTGLPPPPSLDRVDMPLWITYSLVKPILRTLTISGVITSQPNEDFIPLNKTDLAIGITQSSMQVIPIVTSAIGIIDREIITSVG